MGPGIGVTEANGQTYEGTEHPRGRRPSQQGTYLKSNTEDSN